MIDTWLFAALCMGILCIAAFIRAIPAPSPHDRVVAANAGITLLATAAVLVCLASGSLFILNISIVFILLLYAGTIACAQFSGEESE